MDQKDITALYFGCYRDTGHYLWVPGMRSLPWSMEIGLLPWPQVDGILCPGYAGQYRTPDSVQHQRQAKLHHKDGWTALAMWDKTVDRRPASNSVFFFRGEHTFEAACEHAEKSFPEVWKRINLAALVTLVKEL